MYDQFIGKFVKLVYKDGKRESRDYVRYIKGKVSSSDTKSVAIKLEKTGQLFAVAVPEIIYIKELRALKTEMEVRA